MVATRCHRVVDVQVKRVFRGDDCREATLRPCRGAIRRLTAGDNGDRASWVCLSNGQRGGETGCPGADDEHVGALGKALSRSEDRKSTRLLQSRFDLVCRLLLEKKKQFEQYTT